MTTLIEKEALLKKFETGALLFQPEVREIIEEQPEALVRCKDCKWHRGRYECDNFSVYGFDYDDFCSLAERKRGR